MEFYETMFLEVDMNNELNYNKDKRCTRRTKQLHRELDKAWKRRQSHPIAKGENWAYDCGFWVGLMLALRLPSRGGY